MKKSFIFIFTMCVLLLTACNGVLPAGVSQEMYDTAVYVIKTTDSYLDGEISAEEAYERIDNIAIPETNDSDEHRYDSIVDSCILCVKIDLLGLSMSSNKRITIADLKSSRNDLAKEINYR